MPSFSFDIVSEVNLQEVDNAVNQAQKELLQRYDFKNSKSSIDFNRNEKKIALIADDDYKMRALRDILSTRLIKRGISIKSLNFGKEEKSFEGTVRQIAEITIGIPKEKAKDLVQIIKDTKLKVQSQIEGDKIRVVSPKKDDLQAIITHLKTIDFSLPLSFCNYR